MFIYAVLQNNYGTQKFCEVFTTEELAQRFIEKIEPDSTKQHYFVVVPVILYDDIP